MPEDKQPASGGYPWGAGSGGFNDLLREITRGVHEAAERELLVAALGKGRRVRILLQGEDLDRKSADQLMQHLSVMLQPFLEDEEPPVAAAPPQAGASAPPAGPDAAE